MAWLIMWVLAGAQAQSWSTVASGVEVAQWTTSTPQIVTALRVDLCTSGVEVRATTSSERGQTTSTWASATSGVVAAVNGGFYTTGYAPDGGRAMGEGSEWSDSTDTNYRGFLAFGEHTLTHSQAGDVEALPSWAEQAVCGDATLVIDGSAVDCGGCGDGAHPRTAVGFSADETTLYMVAVDGRSSSSAGITIDDLAVLMRDLGAHRAMNLDGGGSTTLWTSTVGVLNDPSDGSERTVGNHLGIISTGSGVQHNCPVGWHGTYAGIAFDGATGSEIVAPAGSVISGAVWLVNTGTETWDTELTRLAPLPRDTASDVAGTDWIAGHRITAVDAATAPGETGTFSFSFQMPETVGTSTRFEFTVLQEGVSWFADSWGPEDGVWYLTLTTTEPVEGDSGSSADTGGSDTGATTDPGGDSAGGTGDTGVGQASGPPGGLVPVSENTGCGCGGTRALGLLWVPILGVWARRRRPHQGWPPG